MTASFNQSIASGGGSSNLNFTLATNYGGSTYLSAPGPDSSINPVQKGYYSISVIGTASSVLQGSIFGIIVEGGLSLYNSGYQDTGSTRFIGSTWYISLNIVKYFAAGDTFNIRCTNWGGANSTVSGVINMRLLNQIP